MKLRRLKDEALKMLLQYIGDEERRHHKIIEMILKHTLKVAVGMVKILINYAKCRGEFDRICVEICPLSIFRREGQEKPVVVNEKKCILCRICQVNCPEQAIQILS